MDGLFLIFFALLIIYLIGLSISSPEDHLNKKEPCKIHKWEYRGVKPYEYMICTNCEKIPSLDLENEND